MVGPTVKCCHDRTDRSPDVERSSDKQIGIDLFSVFTNFDGQALSVQRKDFSGGATSKWS